MSRVVQDVGFFRVEIFESGKKFSSFKVGFGKCFGIGLSFLLHFFSLLKRSELSQKFGCKFSRIHDLS